MISRRNIKNKRSKMNCFTVLATLLNYIQNIYILFNYKKMFKTVVLDVIFTLDFCKIYILQIANILNIFASQ